MYKRLLTGKLSKNQPFCLCGGRGVGKTSLIKDFASKFSNHIFLDLETEVDRATFEFNVPAEETLKAISFLKGKEILGSGTLIVLDELYRCPAAIDWIRGWTGGQVVRWAGGQVGRWAGGLEDRWAGGQVDRQAGGLEESRAGGNFDGWKRGPLVVATSSVITKEIASLVNPGNGIMQLHNLYPFSFEEFLIALEDTSALEAFREVPVPVYAYEKLLHYFHLYALIGGMPEVVTIYLSNHHLTGLKKIYEKTESRFIDSLPQLFPGTKSRHLAIELLQNIYPYAATRISFNRFGNLEKGSREIGKVLKTLEHTFFLQLLPPVTSTRQPMVHDRLKFPRLQLIDTGLVNYFSGIQKPLFQSHDMNAIFEGQIARQVVGQEILASGSVVNFWIRNKAQSTAEVDFILPYDDLLIPVIVRSGEPGRLRSLHQFIDEAPHPFAVRLHSGQLGIRQGKTVRGKQFYLLNLPYFLAGKVRDHLKGFIRLANG